MVVSRDLRSSLLRLATITAWNKVADHPEPHYGGWQELLSRGEDQSDFPIFHKLKWKVQTLSINSSQLFAAQYCGCDVSSPNSARATIGTSSIVPRTKNKDVTAGALKKSRETRYDFIVVGCGNAGASALKTLRRCCPKAKIAVVDPSHGGGDSGASGLAARVKADYWLGRAVSLNQDQSVEIETTDSNHSLLSYRHSILIATGSRGAPPPYYLIDEQCDDQSVLELRPTSYEGSEREMAQSKEYVYSKAVADRHKVCILGSGWEAMELIARTSFRSQRKNRPCLVMGCHGPLSQVLPSYLSIALSKRLKSKGVEVFDRSLVRYISRTKDSRLQIYTAKSFDFLDGCTIACDKVIIAPDVEGSRGTAMLPTDEVPEFLLGSTKGRPWYLSWAHLSPPIVTCYQDDGRIVVNTELCAASGVFAAGSVAKFPNDRTGNAAVAGYGIYDGAQAGIVAGNNMAREYWNKIKGSANFTVPLVKDSIPVWCSDAIFPDGESALQRIGVQALCVGLCESESLSTHGVWWTNHAAQRKLLGSSESEADEDAVRKRVKSTLKRVYGLGFVFYLDGNGKIHGVMAWGLPYRTAKANALNAELISHMKYIIHSNGGLRSLETDQDLIRMARFLEDQAKEMASLALSGSELCSSTDKSLIAGLSRPLHRYTEIRAASLRSLGFNRAKDGRSHSVKGENLFSREENDDLPDVPVPKPDMSRNIGAAAAEAKAFYDWNVWEQIERRWEENETRARPSKEDPLWIRKGDETRNITQQDRLASAYRTFLGAPSSAR